MCVLPGKGEQSSSGETFDTEEDLQVHARDEHDMEV